MPERTRNSDSSGQMRIHHKKNRVRRIKRQENKSIAYEASVLDSLPGKNRCHSRPIVGSSWLLQVKWQSWQSNSLGIIFRAQSTMTSAGVMNFRVICGYSIFEEPHCGQRIRAAEMFGSVASHSIMSSWALSKSLSSTITFAFACGRDMKPTCCSGASL